MRSRLALAILVIAAIAASGRDAAARPSTTRLVVTGGAMAVPAYFAGVAWHEGSHALAAAAFGAEITSLKLYPHCDERTGAFFFGSTSYRGRLGRGEQAVFLLAPRMTDLVLMSGYGALSLTGTLPDNAYGQLALVVFATAAWVDFSKDLISWQPANDLNRFHALYGRDSEWQKLPWRLVHAALIVATGYAVYRGYAQLFADDDTGAARADVLVPLWSARY
jgi:hypothetical protein